MTYFLIHCSEDGDVSVTPYEKDDLLRAIKNKDYGPIEFMENINYGDPQYWGNKSLIIKGEIVIPKPKKVVEEYEI